MSLPCPSCKRRTVEIRQYEHRSVSLDVNRASSRIITQARCEYCFWSYSEAHDGGGASEREFPPVRMSPDNTCPSAPKRKRGSLS